jgi:hypothetical protein
MNSYTYLLCLTAGISGFLFGYDTSGQQYLMGSGLQFPSHSMSESFCPIPVISAALVNIGTDIGGRLLPDTEKEVI